MAATITIFRRGQFMGSLRAVKLYIDGQYAGEVRNEAHTSLSMAPGSHRLQAKVDWNSSEELPIQIKDGQELRISCEILNTLNMKHKLDWFTRIVGGKGTILLQQEGDDAVSLPPVPKSAPLYSPQPEPSSEPAPAPAPVTVSDLKEAIFISYRRKDSPHISGRIYDKLKEHFGDEAVFRDIESIPRGIDFRKYLEQSTKHAKIFLVIIGDKWVDARDDAGQRRLENPADYVRLEIESALRREIPIIPLLVNDAVIPNPAQLPESMVDLAYYNGAKIRYDPDFHHDMDVLIGDLEQILKL